MVPADDNPLIQLLLREFLGRNELHFDVRIETGIKLERCFEVMRFGASTLINSIPRS